MRVQRTEPHEWEMFQLSYLPTLKAMSLIIMQTNYFQIWTISPFCFHQHYDSASWGSIQSAVKMSHPKIPWIVEAGRLIWFSNRFEIWQADQQHIRLSNFRAIGVFFISISRPWFFKRLEANCLQTATAPQGETEKWLQGPSRVHPPRTPASVPPLPPS